MKTIAFCPNARPAFSASSREMPTASTLFSIQLRSGARPSPSKQRNPALFSDSTSAALAISFGQAPRGFPPGFAAVMNAAVLASSASSSSSRSALRSPMCRTSSGLPKTA